MKRHFICLVILLVLPAAVFGQERVRAEDIMRDVERGEPIRYEGVEIVGDLDFTKISDVSQDREDRGDRSGRHRIKLGRSVVISTDDCRHRYGSSRTYWCHVESPLSFVDCVFRGNVLAYFNDEWEKATYNAVFHEDVDFTGCEFMRESAFKYARFRKDACFEGAVFEEEALFKYTRFSSDIRFSGTVFHGDANFKYTCFPESAAFDEVRFNRTANFKYTEFTRGVTFRNAVFRRDAIFKYAEMTEPVDFDGADLGYGTDFRYATVDGRRFTSYLLRSGR